MFYNKNGALLTCVRKVNGSTINGYVYDGMPDSFKKSITKALEYINGYLSEHDSSYAICQYNDVHDQFNNEPKFIEMHVGSDFFSRVLFLGDIANDGKTATLNNAKTFMGLCDGHRIIAIGNHEWSNVDGGYASSVYLPLVDSGDVQNMKDGIVSDGGFAYYSDDEDNNVRYIVFDCSHSVKTLNKLVITQEMANWVSDCMDSANGKDVILCTHSMINPFTVIEDSSLGEAGSTLSSSFSTATISSLLVPIISEYMSGGGSVVAYLSGHYHVPGYSNSDGFNMITGPSMKTYIKGLTFYIVDRTLSKIIWIVCDEEKEDYIRNEYSY